MKQQGIIRHLTAPGIPVIFLFTSLCIALWFLLFRPDTNLMLSAKEISPLAGLLTAPLLELPLVASLISLVFCLLNSFLLSLLNTSYGLIRIRSFLPVFCFLLLMSVTQQTQLLYVAHLALTLLILTLFIFLSTFRDPRSVEQNYLAGFLLACSGIILPCYFLLSIIFWIASFNNQSFSLRNFLASLCGLLTVCVLYCGVIFLLNNDSTDFAAQLEFFRFRPFYVAEETLFYEKLYYFFMIALSILSIIQLYADFSKNSSQTRKSLNLVVLLLLASIALRLLYGNCFASLTPLSNLSMAILLAYGFTLKSGKFQQVLFILFCIANLLFAVGEHYL